MLPATPTTPLTELKPLMRLGSFTRIAPTGFTRFMHAGGETGGVLTADDARRALSVGADVLVVSNHGDRHLGRAPVSLTALAEVTRRSGPGRAARTRRRVAGHLCCPGAARPGRAAPDDDV